MPTIENQIANLRAKNLPVILELGPGETKVYPDAIGIDWIEKPSVDYIWDLTKGLSFIADNEIDLIYSSHFLEHIDDLAGFLAEVNRVLKVGGKKIGIVPHFSNPYFYSDYTHKNFWGLYSLNYFSSDNYFKRGVPSYYNKLDFKINHIKLEFLSPFKYRWHFKKMIEKWINSSRFWQEFYEENLTGIIGCYQIYFEIEKKA